MKFAALCNSRMGIPSLQSLSQSGMLATVGVPLSSGEPTDQILHFCSQAGIPAKQFSKDTFANEIENWLREYRPEAVLVYTFPFIIPKSTLEIPRQGFINFHFAPLPEFRGSDPIFRLICNGEKAGAVTVHKMTPGLDKGPVAVVQPVPIGPLDTYGMHMGNLSMAALQVTHQFVSRLVSNPGSIQWQLQDESKARYWPKQQAADVTIQWSKMKAAEVLALIRACNPWNHGAYTFLGGAPLRITLASAAPAGIAKDAAPGIFIADGNGMLAIACADGEAIYPDTVYFEAGYFSGKQLTALGLQAGMRLTGPQGI